MYSYFFIHWAGTAKNFLNFCVANFVFARLYIMRKFPVTFLPNRHIYLTEGRSTIYAVRVEGNFLAAQCSQIWRSRQQCRDFFAHL